MDIAGPMGGTLAMPDSIAGSRSAFIAAGTGVTPFRSMIRYLIDRAAAPDFWLFHSVRSQSELLFDDDFVAWSEKYATISLCPDDHAGF